MKLQPVLRLAHPEGSLADISMISPSFGTEAREPEGNSLTDGIVEKLKEKQLKEEESRHCSEGTEEPPSEQSTGTHSPDHGVRGREL